MGRSNVVTLYYGPYESHGLIRHKPQRLYGLIKALEKRHYKVEVVPTQIYNYMYIKMRDLIVHSCAVNLLGFNLNYDDDSICRKIVNVIKKVSADLEANTRPAIDPDGSSECCSSNLSSVAYRDSMPDVDTSPRTFRVN